MLVQMPLKIGLRDEASFDTFVAEQESVALALNALQSSVEKPVGEAFYLCGHNGVGKTHLLQAACRLVTEKNRNSVYLPLADKSLPFIPDVLSGLEQVSLVCLDDIDRIIGKKEWEIALANLITKCSVQGNTLLIAGTLKLSDWKLAYSELAKSLISVVPLVIEPVSEKDELINALQRHAKCMGFELPEKVGELLLKHCSNDLSELMKVLKMLEEASLVQKRRLTLQFVKAILGVEPAGKLNQK
ncbi:DnaA regulatory inactivator Hda [Thiomicrorhabdus indica]|uniref:DnaA regulatory inactivator Hda n=1 Tax=Thiomicrorhabdus indica TaxID=2267253 RepID=UPI00102DED49|nr:DnaA regulatory inactivator Hda [Thiomicrorhabdus indica]